MRKFIEAAIAREVQIKLCYLHRFVCSNELFNLGILNLLETTQQQLFSVKITLLLASHKMLQL